MNLNLNTRADTSPVQWDCEGAKTSPLEDETFPDRPSSSHEDDPQSGMSDAEEQTAKDYASSKWQAAFPSRSKHAADAAKFHSRSARKRALRKTKDGRMAAKQLVENQAEPKVILDATLVRNPRIDLPDPSGEVTEDERSMLSYLTRDGSESSSETLQKLSLTMLTYFVNLCVCEEATQYAAATLQMFSGVVASTNFPLDSVLQLAGKWWEDPETIENQGALHNVREKLIQVRDGYLSYTSIPVWQQIQRCLVIAALVGYLPKDTPDGAGVLEKGVYAWMKTAHIESENASLFEAVLSSLIFACDFAISVKDGTLGSFISPEELQSRCARIVADEVLFRNGMLQTKDSTPGRYQNEVKNALAELNKTLKTSRHSASRLVLLKYCTELTRISNVIDSSMKNIAPRQPAPIIVITGDSHIGKSGMMYAIATLLGENFGFPTKDENIYYKRVGDAYDSGFTGEKTVIIEDDRGAEKDKFKTASCLDDIAHCNIVPYQSLQAALEGKGVIPYLHWLKLVSCNFDDADVLSVFKLAGAGFNRIWIYQSEVKPEYRDEKGRIDPKKVGDADVLDPRVHRTRKIEWTNTAPKGAKPAWQKSEGEWMDTPVFFAELVHRYGEKMESGTNYLRQIENIRKCSVCPKCKLFKAAGYCQCTELQNQADMVFPQGISMNAMVFQSLGYVFSAIPDVGDITSRWLNYALPFYQDVERYAFTQFLTSMTGMAFDNAGGFIIKVLYWLTLLFRRSFVLTCAFLWPFALITFIVFNCYAQTCRYLLLLWFVMFCILYRRIKRIFVACCVSALQKEGRFGPSRFLLRIGTLGVAVSGALIAINKLRKIFELHNQGNLIPQTLSDIEKRNGEKNPWIDNRPPPLPRTDNIANMTHDQSITSLSRNVVRVADPFGSCGLFTCSNVVILPYHALADADEDGTYTFFRNDAVGGKFSGVKIMSYVDMGNDHVAATVSNAPSFADITEFFVDDIYKGKGVCTMISRNEEGAVELRTLQYAYQDYVSNETHSAPGSRHMTNIPVKRGLCASPIVLQGCPSKIIGLHCAGGTVEKCLALCFCVSKQMVKQAMDILKQRHIENHSYVGCLPLPTSDPLTTICGKDCDTFTGSLHERDCVNYVPEPTPERPHCLEVYRVDLNGKFKRHSEVRTSKLSQHLEAEGRPQKWGPPKFRVNRNFGDAMKKMIEPVVTLPASLLSECMRDYIDPIIAEAKRLGYKASPLSWYEALNGRRNARFCKAMPMKTSPGFGLSAPKSKHLTLTVEDDGRHAYTMTPEVQKDAEEILAMVRRGVVPKYICKTALKDEPTLLTKEKVRVFTVIPMAFNIVVRMLMLPIMEYMFAIPLLAEMSQGLNCTNDEWHQLGEWMHVDDETAYLAGDFSSYDSKTSGQMTRACGWMMRLLAIALGYSDEDALAVEILFCSFASKYIVWNGTLIHIDSMTLSGIPVTVFVNGLCNGMYHRIAFFKGQRSLFNETRFTNFREWVRMGFVGDDSIGHSKLKWFNMKFMQAEMAKIGMVYTDADKSANTIDFYRFEQINFCKRKFRFHEKIGMYVAPLSLDSIYKSLHCYMLSITADTDIIVGNVDGALRELARHEEEIFNAEVAIIRRACQRAGIEHLIPRLRYDYTQWWSLLQSDFGLSVYPKLQDPLVEAPAGSVCSMESLD